MPRYDVLIIGSGLAAATLALSLPGRMKVALVTKKQPEDSSSAWAQGGIAAVMGADDSFEDHVRDTLVAGAGLCNEAVVRHVVESAPAALGWLMEQGVPFDRDGNTFHLGREGGHSRRRILHAADATGKTVQDTLLARLGERKNLTLLAQHIAIDVITDHRLHRDGHGVHGAYVLDTVQGRVKTLAAGITVLATGGAGKAFLYTTNPDTATGDGIAMAWRAGCRVANMEFIQFHPTCLYHPHAKSFLITEAMRGEGALLRLPDGTRFMPEHDERGELAPRDVVARAIDFEMKKRGLDCVYLDITHKPAKFIVSHFPTIHARCMELGIDITREWIPVAPAAHYTCGGVLVDRNGRTDVERLYAIGEASGTGLHGANRLASNSLLEGLVFGRRTGLHLRDHPGALLPLPYAPPGTPPVPIPAGGSAAGEAIREEFRNTMWADVGIIRSDESLGRAIGRMQEWLDRLAGDPTLPARETAGMVLVGLGIATAAQQRQGSRGGHFRADFPERGPYGNRHVDLRLDPAGRPEAFWTE
jgi:L-aspartate oxidase